MDKEANELDEAAVGTLTIRDGAEGETAEAGDLVRPGGLQPYVRGRQLAEGGMGAIHEAAQRSLHRVVVEKTLLPHRRNPRDQRAFIAEAMATAALEHPHIVPVHDLVAGPNGDLRLIMKRVEGRTWKDLLHPRGEEAERLAGLLDLDDHLEVLLKVCDAVAYAHSHGVLHRDLKPENVMLGDYGEVLVMDWGCAAVYGTGKAPPAVPRVEHLQTVTGTPAYMAPEQACANGPAQGPWSDVYCLGATLYEVLCGSAPHRGTTVRAVVLAAVDNAIEAPRHRNPARAMPDELVELALAALASEPRQRPSVREFAGRLRARRRHGEAARLVERARNHLAAGERALDLGRIRLALACCEQAHELWPDRAIKLLALRCHLAAGQLALQRGEAQSAREHGDAARTLSADQELADHGAEAETLLATVGKAVALAQREDPRLERLRRRCWLLAAVTVAVAGLALWTLLGGGT